MTTNSDHTKGALFTSQQSILVFQISYENHVYKLVILYLGYILTAMNIQFSSFLILKKFKEDYQIILL
jgi:hypothetical protein